MVCDDHRELCRGLCPLLRPSAHRPAHAPLTLPVHGKGAELSPEYTCVFREPKGLLRTPVQDACSGCLHRRLHGGRILCWKMLGEPASSVTGCEHSSPGLQRVPAVSKTEALPVCLRRQPDPAAVSVCSPDMQEHEPSEEDSPPQKDLADFRCYGEVRDGLC